MARRCDLEWSPRVKGVRMAGAAVSSADMLAKEYFVLAQTVTDYDQRLMTVKGWGTTLSLAALGFGFQYGHYGLFLVAALSGIAFWLLEDIFKKYQMRYYYRMREIEVHEAMRARDSGEAFSSPRIDWAWSKAGSAYAGKKVPPTPENYGKNPLYRVTFLLPQVFLPHLISVAAGTVLFLAGVTGFLTMKL
jgi:hypothetical protein